jgi:hypothetical protein
VYLNAASVFLRFLLGVLVLAILAFVTLRTPMAWMTYVALVFGAIVILVLGILIGFSVRRFR